MVFFLQKGVFSLCFEALREIGRREIERKKGRFLQLPV